MHFIIALHQVSAQLQLLMLLLLLIHQARSALLPNQARFFTDVCALSNIGLLPQARPWCVRNSDPCTWTGVTCTAGGTVVESLIIGSTDSSTVFPLNGRLPSSVEQLSSLREFQLRCADGLLEGDLSPRFFAAIAETAESLTVFQCPLVAGTLPTASGLPLLRSLRLISTNIGSTLSEALIAESPLLRTLQVTASNFSGPLPDNFDASPSLVSLFASYNRFSGAFPASLCRAPNLQIVLLEKNYLSVFPDCIAATMNPTVVCDLRGNFYCGEPAAATIVADTDRRFFGPCELDAQVRLPDQCDVCGGDGSSCVGCDGVPNSSAVNDACGVCGGGIVDETLCPDCAGTPGGSRQYDACGECGGSGLACRDCAGVPFGTLQYDACDVCGGDESTCTDCAGELWGTRKRDACGVCEGDGSTCLDCAGVPAGSKRYDACGECGGSGLACRDCAGVPFGSQTLDACGQCGGDGTTCGLEFLRRQTGQAQPVVTTLLLLALIVCIFACCPLLLCALVRSEQRRR